MNITVYTSFSKRKNSTKQPTGGTSVTCDIKHTNSMRTPIFHINKDDLTGGITPESIKYVKDTDHSIYYYVDDVEYVPNKFYALHCTIDPMATYKSAITGSTFFVLYSATQNSPYVPDPRIPKQSEVLVRKIDSDGGHHFHTPPLGYYVMQCIADDSDANKPLGGRFLTTYLMEERDMAYLAYQFCDTDFASSIFLSLSAAFECLTSIMYIPLNVTPIPSGQQKVNIYLGKESMYPAQGWVMSSYNNVVKLSDKFTPSWTYFDDWRMAPPYTTAELYIPGYGTVDINPLHCDTALYVDTYVDYFTGDTTAIIKGENQTSSQPDIIATLNYNIGINIPVGKYTTNAMGAVSALTTAGGNAFTAAATASPANAYATGASIGNAIVQLNSKTASVKGSTGGMSWLTDDTDNADYFLYERCVNTFNIDCMNTTHGQPLMKEVALSTLSGYCQCMDASVSINGFDADRDIINGYLNGGFYLE